ncbi:hypothetical protein CW735_13810 [Alteromonas sp. MB-3u-76]|uniref:hypothetical protein n=1 Tax=Alteromonas sp. MB-3u-76 TaxID=2058133 RepID=UPI000C312227|nr:hypothetical protein [Alteromonas sp. MB-3u-76]AUC89121.1 hypothetical protein CW735_13810 [Alteromonas sp. MB-3u-76]
MKFSVFKDKLVRKIDESRLNSALEGYLNLDPVESNSNAEVTVMTQLYAKAIYMGVAAIHSLIRKLECSVNIEVIDDGSLTNEHHVILFNAFPGLTITKIENIERYGCPAGGCWERLLRIQELTDNYYVIQVDTDILVVNEIPEINDCINANRAFISSSPDWPKTVSIDEIVDYSSKSGSQNIQFEAERQLSKITSIDLAHYVRGCAAFTGFPKGAGLTDKLSKFSQEMESILGKRWHEWGTEQFACNTMIALCENLNVLPWPKYQNFCFPEFRPLIEGTNFNEEVAVIHFIGSNRFKYNVYLNYAKSLLNLLSNK